MTIPLKVYLWLAGAVIVTLGYAAFVAHEREVGRLDLMLRSANSVAVVRRQQFDSVQKAAVAANVTAFQFQQRYEAHRAGDADAERHTNAALEALTTARDSAMALAMDTTATVLQLTYTIGKLIEASDSAQAMHSAEREQFHHSLALADAALAADRLALAKGVDATNAAVARAVAAETQRDVLRKAMPSTAGRYVTSGILLVVGVAAGHFIK